MALPVPANGGVFTYRLREGSVEPGRRVQVPLGRRSATGIVLGFASAARGELRDVVRVLDDAPLLAPDVLHLARWAAAHYLSPIGLAVRAALPPGIDLREELCAELTAAGEALLEGSAQRTFLPAGREAASRTRQLLRALRDGRAVRPAQLRALEKRGLVSLSSTEARPRVRAAQVEVVAAAPAAQVPPRSPKQAAVLAWLLARDPGGVPVEELLAAFPGARPHLRKLAARRLVAIREEPAGAAALVDAPWGNAAIRETPAQAAALVELRAALDARRYAPFLLHGVTGSGKTHVYMEAIAHARAQGRGALALVPEIALTPQLAGRFRARFGDDVAVLHSGLSERERLSEWERVRSARAGLVVGARSAVFAPVHGLGIVVVDEEHEPSYKQEDRLRYHARDLALVRAREANAVVVLGSATPSLETLRRAYEGKLRTLRLPERVDGRALPPVEIVDRKSTLRAEGGEPALITPELAAALRETMARREQAILYLNKRGHVRSLLCRSCGAALGCPNCSVALVLHRAGGTSLRCHLCGHEELPRPCAACGGDELVPLAAGTERVEEELRALLPEARAARLDRDSATGPGKAAALLARFARREIDVLIGTQMIAKGHDFPGVTLVGALDADGPLRLPDFRAGERCVQLLAQVAGRAGRGEQPGRVILQAFRPTDPAVVAAAAHDYEGFARGELERRGALSFPPYARLCAVRVQGNVEARAQAAAERLGSAAVTLVRRGERADVLGPAPAPIARIRGKHRFQLVLRANEHGPLHRICRALAEVALPAGVDMTVDVDPVALV